MRGAQDGVAALKGLGDGDAKVGVRVPLVLVVGRGPLGDEERAAEGLGDVDDVAAAGVAGARLERDGDADLGRAGERVLGRVSGGSGSPGAGAGDVPVSRPAR